MLRTTWLAAAFAVAASAWAPADAGLMLQNGGFESGGLGSWYQGRNFGLTEPWQVTSAEAHTGAFSATAVGNGEIRQDFAPIATDAIDSITFWLNQPEYANDAAVVTFFYGSSSSQFLLMRPGDGWTLFDVTGYLTPGETLTGFSLFGYSDSVVGSGEDRTYLDDVSILTAQQAGPTAPEPGTLALMGLGGVGLAIGRMRKRRAAAAAA